MKTVRLKRDNQVAYFCVIKEFLATPRGPEPIWRIDYVLYDSWSGEQEDWRMAQSFFNKKDASSAKVKVAQKYMKKGWEPAPTID